MHGPMNVIKKKFELGFLLNCERIIFRTEFVDEFVIYLNGSQLARLPQAHEQNSGSVKLNMQITTLGVKPR